MPDTLHHALIAPTDDFVVTHVIAAGGRRIPVDWTGVAGMHDMDPDDRPIAPFLPVGVIVDVYDQTGEHYATLTLPPIGTRGPT